MSSEAPANGQKADDVATHTSYTVSGTIDAGAKTPPASPFAAVQRLGAAADNTGLKSTPDAPQPSRVTQFINKYKRKQLDTTITPSFVILCAVIYGALFFAIGDAFLPGHATWALLLMWASSLLGAMIAHQLYLPRVIGMLVAGMLLQNIPWSAIDAFPAKWGIQLRAAALATIFLRCGLELDFGTMRRYKYPALRLALIPGITEALYDAGLGVALFGMDFTLALTMGFILKAVGPGLVVPAMFKLQKSKMGTDQGIPATVVISASFDDIVAITGYAIFSTIAIQPYGNSSDVGTDAAWSIASGPLQVIFGILGGLLAGVALGATRVWNTHTKRFVALFFSGMLLMFFLEYYNLLSGGALGALFTGLVASNLWEKGQPRAASLGPSFVYSPECERWMSVIWRWIMEPILFVTIGSTLNFASLETGTIPKAVCIVVTGLLVRIIFTYAAMTGFGYSARERIFFAVAWTPKATVQAALSAAPLTLITRLKVGAPDYDEWVAWGNDILTTGLFAIIICGTLGVLAIHVLHPMLIKPAAKEEDVDGEEEDGQHGDAPPGASPGGGNEFLGGGVAIPQHQSIDGRPASPGSRTYRSISRSRMAASCGDVLRDAAHHSMDLKRAASEGPSRGASPSPPFAALVAGEDLTLVAEYIESIQSLTTAVNAGDSREDVMRLSQRVQDMQHRIESEVGYREPSVRELFRTASILRVRPAAGRLQSGSRHSGSWLHPKAPPPGDDAV